MVRDLRSTPFIHIAALLVFVFGLISCGSPRTGKKDSLDADAEKNVGAGMDCGESSHDNDTTTVRLKGSALMAKTFQAALGEGITKDPITNEDLFAQESTAQNFGTAKDGMYADVKSQDQTMTAYMMSLNYAGRTAAVNCAARNFEGLCACDNEDAAASLLQRAVTFRRFCANTKDSYVTELVTLCQKSPADAITSVMTSLAIALLQ